MEYSEYKKIFISLLNELINEDEDISYRSSIILAYLTARFSGLNKLEADELSRLLFKNNKIFSALLRFLLEGIQQ